MQAPDSSFSELIKIFLNLLSRKLLQSCAGKPSQLLFLPSPRRCGFARGSPRPPLVPLPPCEAPSQGSFPRGAEGTARAALISRGILRPPAAGCFLRPCCLQVSPLWPLRRSGQRPPVLELAARAGGGDKPRLFGTCFWQRLVAHGEQLQHRHLQCTGLVFPSVPARVLPRASRPSRRAAEPPAEQCQQPEPRLLPEGFPRSHPVGFAAPRGSAEPRCRSAPCGCVGAAAPRRRDCSCSVSSPERQPPRASGVPAASPGAPGTQTLHTWALQAAHEQQRRRRASSAAFGRALSAASPPSCFLLPFPAVS